MTGKKPISNSDWQETNLSVACQLKKCLPLPHAPFCKVLNKSFSQSAIRTFCDWFLASLSLWLVSCQFEFVIGFLPV